MQVLTLVQQTVIYRVASNYGGETSQILLGAALRVWNFAFVPLWGISQGFQPAAGTNYGAKDYNRVKKLTGVFVASATILSLLFYIRLNYSRQMFCLCLLRLQALRLQEPPISALCSAPIFYRAVS